MTKVTKFCNSYVVGFSLIAPWLFDKLNGGKKGNCTVSVAQGPCRLQIAASHWTYSYSDLPEVQAFIHRSTTTPENNNHF